MNAKDNEVIEDVCQSFQQNQNALREISARYDQLKSHALHFLSEMIRLEKITLDNIPYSTALGEGL